jgi:hypothetical protein
MKDFTPRVSKQTLTIYPRPNLAEPLPYTTNCRDNPSLLKHLKLTSIQLHKCALIGELEEMSPSIRIPQ